MDPEVERPRAVATDAQREMCDRYGVTPVPTPGDLKVGVARGGEGPIHGLRHRPECDTAGWYIWRGEFSDADDFFLPLHASQLKDGLPEVLPGCSTWSGYFLAFLACRFSFSVF
jgi:hypothetical protein